MVKFLNDYKALCCSKNLGVKLTIFVISRLFIVCGALGLYMSTIFLKIGLLINIFNIIFFIIIFKLLQNC